MHQVLPVGQPAANLLLCVPENRVQVAFEDNGPGVDVELPDADPSRTGGEGVPLLRLAQRLLRPPPLGNVANDAEDPVAVEPDEPSFITPGLTVRRASEFDDRRTVAGDTLERLRKGL